MPNNYTIYNPSLIHAFEPDLKEVIEVPRFNWNLMVARFKFRAWYLSCVVVCVRVYILAK